MFKAKKESSMKTFIISIHVKKKKEKNREKREKGEGGSNASNIERKGLGR